MKRALLIVAILVGLALFAGAGALWTLRSFIALPASESDEVVVFEVKPGDTFKGTARRLEEQGLITSATKLELYARFSKMGAKVRVGEYAIRRNAKPTEILSVITSGHSVEYVVTISEGLNKYEIADALERQNVAKRDEFLALVKDRALIKELLGEDLPHLEGYLFPETYHITKFTGAKDLVKMMVNRFKENYAKVGGLPTLPDGTKMTRHQLVTLASIIEKETGAPEERPVISSVFHNRLKLNMRLQTDPTVIYGIWDQTGQWNRNITRNDLLTPNRYNTYTNAGLPYGPIANPGFQALKAAAAPAQSDFLFFVSRNDGTHTFSKDYAGHQKAVTQFQLDRKAREGKSWRDLQKRNKAPSAVTDGSTMAPKAAATPKRAQTSPAKPVSTKQ